MNHPNEDVLALHAAGDLGAIAAWRVRRHVVNCDECRAIVEEYAQMRVEMSSLPTPEPPANLDRMILSAIPRGEAAPARLAWFGWGWAAAAAVAAVAVVAVIPRLNVEIGPPPQYVARAPFAPEVTKTPPPPSPAETPAATAPAQASPKFTAVADAEQDRDLRYLHTLAAANRPSAALDRWAVAATNENRHLPRVVVGQRAEMLRSHALQGRVEAVALPGSPLEIVHAEAYFAEGRLVDPSVEVRNISGHPLQDFELIWVVRDASGNEFRCRSVSAKGKVLAPGQRANFSDIIVMEPEQKGAESQIASARIFVRATTAADGVWVPDRATLEAKHLDTAVPVTAQTAQVLDAYHRQGPRALAQLLK